MGPSLTCLHYLGGNHCLVICSSYAFAFLRSFTIHACIPK